MSDHILIATDGSDVAESAIEQGLVLAKALGARVTFVTVTEPWWMVAPSGAAAREPGATPIEAYDERAAEWAGRVLEVAVAAAKARGISATAVHVPDEHPAEGIIATARTHGCTMIAMGSHGRSGLSRLLLGSQSIRVATHAPIPVLICR
jgi:nucleotide-binding universal stress UspA family protein